MTPTAGVTGEANIASPKGIILFVCTGNICRSPFLELMLRRSLAQRHITAIAVRSAGTDALLRRPVATPMAEILNAEGIDSSSFRPRQIDRQMVRSADLILTADRGHRAIVARMLPAALPRILTLKQAARLIDLAPPDRDIDWNTNPVSRLAALCSAGRTLNRPSAGTGDDIPDPWQQPRSTYRAVAAMMKEPLDVLTSALEADQTAPSFQAES